MMNIINWYHKLIEWLEVFKTFVFGLFYTYSTSSGFNILLLTMSYFVSNSANEIYCKSNGAF